MAQAPLMLSVSGVRGIVGESLTPPIVARLAAVFGSWLRETQSQRAAAAPPHVVIGRDSRTSGSMVELAATAGLLAVGCRVTTLGIVSTPGVAVMVDELRAAGGMVLTASHNPIAWNGVKLLRHDGAAPTHDQAQRIIARFHADDAHYVDALALQSTARRDDTARIHTERILKLVDVQAIRAAKLKAVVDSVHGAGAAETVALLEALGVELVHLYPEPTGRFPHTPEPTKENLVELCTWIPRCQADVGFAQDPDADRLAVVDEQGVYIGEEYTLALCAKHAIKAGQVTVANLSTSRMLDDVAQQRGATVVRTPVGEANVAAAMQAHRAAIGGEGNGGIILPAVSCVRDSLVGMALLLEMLATTGRPVSEHVRDIPAYAIVKEKIPADPALAARLAPLMQKGYTQQSVDLQDGVRVDWPDAWVHVRPSNTEPIFRLVAEAPTMEKARALLADVRQTLGLG